MGLSLLFPLGLAALASLLLPLLIHLARRQESRLTEFAALRWLRAQPKPRQRIRIDEWPLLLVRLLLLALIALLMAGLAWREHDARQPRVLVSPGIDAAAQRALRLPAEARVQWLAPGFPAIDTPAPAASQPVASLLREFDATMPASAALTVIVPATWGAVDAQRPVLSRAVDWQVLPGSSPMAAKMPVAMPTLVAVGLAASAPELRTLRALHAAWQPQAGALATVEAPGERTLPPGTLAVWGGHGAVPAMWLDWVRQGGELLLVSADAWPAAVRSQAEWRDDGGEILLASAAFGRGRLWQWSQGLDPARVPRLLDARFPAELAQHLRPASPPLRTVAADFAPLQQPVHWPTPPPALLPGLALLIALLFALERWLATSPRSGAPA